MRNIALIIGGLLVAAACGSPAEVEPASPGLEAEASAAALVLVAACRRQADACGKRATEHPCRIGDPSCMTAGECNAQSMMCISEALNH